MASFEGYLSLLQRRLTWVAVFCFGCSAFRFLSSFSYFSSGIDRGLRPNHRGHSPTNLTFG